MVEKIQVRPLRWFERLADWLCFPFMWALVFFLESPQRTHFWNNAKLQIKDVQYLMYSKMVYCNGIPEAEKRGRVRFHLPFCGGWRDYVVLEPQDGDCKEWYVGWITGDNIVGISRIKNNGPVRVLLGPDEVSFFGVTQSGEQVPLQKVGTGRIWDRGPFRMIPLS